MRGGKKSWRLKNQKKGERVRKKDAQLLGSRIAERKVDGGGGHPHTRRASAHLLDDVTVIRDTHRNQGTYAHTQPAF